MGQVLLNGLSVASIFGLAAVGLTLIFGVMRVIQFAHGEMALVAAYVVYALWSRLGWDPLLAGAVAIVVVVALAWLEFEVVIRRLIPEEHLNQIVGTLGVALLIQGAILVIFGGDGYGVNSEFTRGVVSIAGARIALPRAVGIILAAVLFAALSWILSRTEFGRQVRAVAQDHEVAELVGVDSVRIQRMVFLIGSGMTGLAGILLIMAAFVEPTSGIVLTLTSFAIVIIGGFGSMMGALAGALVLGLGQSFVGAYVPGGSGWIPAVAFLIIILAALVMPLRSRHAN